MLQDREMTWFGTPVKIQGDNSQVGNECGKAFIGFIPFVTGGSDNTEVWGISE